MTDERFDDELRGLLGSRVPSGASPALRARVLGVTAERVDAADRWRGRASGTWRVATALVATAAVAAVLLAALLRLDGISVRDPGRVGGPSAAPGVPRVPFVIAPAGTFTTGAGADAERRLEAVFEATGVEATLLVQRQADTTSLSTPEGWPGSFDRDGRGARDVIAVVGVAPDGSLACCLTIAGDLIDRAQEEGYWRPTDQPAALDDDLAATTAESRDVGLDRFVRGIEAMAPKLSILESQLGSRDTVLRVLGSAAISVPLLFLAVRGLRRRPAHASGEAGPHDTGIEVESRAPMVAAVGPGDGHDAGTIAGVAARFVGSGRGPVAMSLAAILGLAALGFAGLLVPGATSVRLDPARDGAGLASPGLDILPVGLLVAALVGLVGYARQGRRARRIAVLGLVLIAGWAGSLAIEASHPALDRAHSWVAGENGAVTWRGLGGLQEQVTYDVEPGAPFTIGAILHNPGPLPVTIMGLDGAQATEPNPFVASFVGIGWVVQPTETGRTTRISAQPQDASVSWPVTLGPGTDLAIVLLGRAGPCAQPGGTSRGLPLLHVDVAYRVLGFERSAEIGLPAILTIPGRDPCTVDSNGTTVTYRNP
jgi:hypothetical protein